MPGAIIDPTHKGKLNEALLKGWMLYVEVRGETERKIGTLYRIQPTQLPPEANGKVRATVPPLEPDEDIKVSSIWLVAWDGKMFRDIAALNASEVEVTRGGRFNIVGDVLTMY